jgi:8-oxo-dGTP diphosphatase
MFSAATLDELVSNAKDDGVQQLVVGAIGREGDKVLLVKRPEADFMGDIYELPNGKVEAGERIDSALISEVADETGLTVSEIEDYIGSFDYTSGSGKKSRQFNFAVTVESAERITLTEHDTHMWAPLNESLPVTDAVEAIFGNYREAHFDWTA